MMLQECQVNKTTCAQISVMSFARKQKTFASSLLLIFQMTLQGSYEYPVIFILSKIKQTLSLGCLMWSEQSANLNLFSFEIKQ